MRLCPAAHPSAGGCSTPFFAMRLHSTRLISRHGFLFRVPPFVSGLQLTMQSDVPFRSGVQGKTVPRPERRSRANTAQPHRRLLALLHP